MNKSYKIITDQAGVVELAQYIQNSKIIALDTETTSLNPRKGQIIGFSVSANIGEGYYFPTNVWNPTRKALEACTIEGRTCDNIATTLLKLLKGKKIVTHNGSFDIRYIKNYYDVDLRDDLYCDTMLLVHTLREDGPFGLKAIATELQAELGLDVEKEANEEQILMKENIKRNGGSITKDNYEIYKADMELLGSYAAADADLTLRLMTYFLPILEEEGLWDFFFKDEVMPLYKTVTIKMEEVGTKFNVPLITKTKKAIRKDIDKLENQIEEELLKLPEVQNWVIDRAVDLFPPKTKGKFFDILKQSLNDPTAAAEFRRTGALSNIPELESVRISMELYKESNNDKYINISSKKQLGEICFNYLEIQPLTQTKKGNDQFNDDMIESLCSEYKWAQVLRDYNKLKKIESSYIDRFLEGLEDDRYFWYQKQHGTTSGRFSSDCQQLPRILEEGEVSTIVLKYNNLVRNFLISEDNRTFIICDQNSLEPRVFASVSNDPNLINVFLNNEDLYSRVAIQAFRLQGMSAKKSDSNYVKTLRPELRQRAKSIALAIPYGAGAWQIGKSLDIHIGEAQRLIDGYLNGFPELAKWMSDTNLRAKTFGRIHSKTGRIRHLDDVKAMYDKMEDALIDPKSFAHLKRMAKTREQTQMLMQARMKYKNGLNNAKNFQIQSLAASIMNRSSIAIQKDLAEKKLDAYIMMQVHDELVIDCDQLIATQVSDIIKNHMENTVQIPTGLVTEPSIVKNYGEGHA